MKKKNKKKTVNAAASGHAADAGKISKLPEFPALGHQLVADKPKAPNDLDTEGWIRIRPSRSQRLRQFGMAYLQGFVFAFIALACLYLPDFLIDYAHREFNFVRFFAVFFFAAVGLVAVCAAINTLIRDTSCHIHPQSGRLVCASRLSQSKINDCIDLRSVPVLEILPPGAFFRRTRIITMHHELEVTIADTGGKDDDIQALYKWLREIRATPRSPASAQSESMPQTSSND